MRLRRGIRPMAKGLRMDAFLRLSCSWGSRVWRCCSHFSHFSHFSHWGRLVRSLSFWGALCLGALCLRAGGAWASETSPVQAPPSPGQRGASLERAPQTAVLGAWITHDDETQLPMARVRLTLEGSHLSGRIEEILDPHAKPGERCELCLDDRHGQAILGLEIIRTGEWDPQRREWQNARILDPERGQEYRLSLTPLNAGNILQVRGYWGIFWRNQLWNRVP